MRFSNGFCLECKHELQIDTTKKTATCPFCGNLYNVEAAITQKDRIVHEIKESNNIQKLLHEAKKNISVNAFADKQLLIYIKDNMIGHILLIQISNKENEILNTYYLEARDKNYIDLYPT